MNDVTWIGGPPVAKVTKAADRPPMPQLKPKAMPIELHYRYTGTCLECGIGIDTLELLLDNNKRKMTIVAWCGVCRKQYQTKEVVKL